MKKQYEKIQVQIILFKNNDFIRTSGEVDGDETVYPTPWEAE